MNHAVTFSVAPVLAVFDDDFNTRPLNLFAAPFTLAFWLPCWLYAWLVAAAPVVYFALTLPAALGPGGWREALGLMGRAMVEIIFIKSLLPA